MTETTVEAPVAFAWTVREDGVVARLDRLPEVTKGGIHLANQAQKPLTGTVVAAGPGKVGPTGARIPADFGVGDRIYFAQYAGMGIALEGQPEGLVLLRFDDVRMVARKGG